MSNNFVEASIGALVLVAAGLFVSFTYDRTEMGTVDGYELMARFDRVDGLSVGSDVRMAGIKVGSVVRQRIDLENYQAVVTISIADEILLPTDSSASISSEGLLGGNYLALVPGGMDEYLESGDEIEFTQGSVDLFGLMRQAAFNAGSSDDEGDD